MRTANNLHLRFFFFKKWAIPGVFFFIFVFFQNTVDSKQMFNI